MFASTTQQNNSQRICGGNTALKLLKEQNFNIYGLEGGPKLIQNV